MIRSRYSNAFALISLVGSSMNAQVYFASDAEPNNNPSQAQMITLGIPFEGRVDAAQGDGLDVYTFMMPDDGLLLLTIEAEGATSGLELVIHQTGLDSSMYPGIGSLIGSSGSPATSAPTLYCMKAGLHVVSIGSAIASSYRITANFGALPFGPDPEPNNDLSTATPLIEGVQADGHASLEFMGQTSDELFDYWRIDKTASGPITLYTGHSAEYPVDEPFRTIQFHDAAGMPIGQVNVTGGFSGQVALNTTVVSGFLDQPGTYYISMTNTANNCYSYSFRWVSGNVGVNENDLHDQQLVISQDPTTGSFLFSGPGIKRVEISDIAGRSVFVKEYSGTVRASWQPTSSVDGVYIARIVDAQGRSRSVRLVSSR